MMQHLLLLSCVVFLVACGSRYDAKYNQSTFGHEAAPNTYIVQRGDTLFSIAWRFGMDKSTIQRRNGISNPNKIFVGQKLRLQLGKGKAASRPAVATTSATASRTKKTQTPVRSRGSWVWPMRGKVVRNFNAKRIGANGIRIAGKPNQTVNAANAGVVAYKGNGLNGYGNVVIIKHQNGLLSAYGFLSKTYVKEGQSIKKRQKIGTVGYAANKQLMLHFEVRRNGRPVNPKSYIGSRYRF